MPFISLFQKWLNALDFGSEEKNRNARYLQGLSLIIIAAALIIAINYVLVGEWLIVGLMAGTALFYASVLGLIRRGQAEMAKTLFVICMLILVTSGLLLKNGMRSAGAFMFPMVIIFASILLKRPRFIFFTLLTLASTGLILYAESQDALVISKFDPVGLPLFITYSLLIIFTAFIMRFVTENWQNSLRKMEQTQDELKRQQTLLAASEARWRTLVMHAPVLIATISREGKIQFVNSEYRDRLTRSAERTIFDFIDTSEQGHAQHAIETCFITGQPGYYEVKATRINPPAEWYSIGLGPVVENGKVVELILIATDITRQKQAEAEVRVLNTELDQRARTRSEEAETAYRELEMFSYAVSHNLRTPARGMTGFAEMLLHDHADQLDTFARNLLRKISANAITMGLMIDDLLEFLQLGRVALKVREVSPTQLAQRALDSLPTYRDTHGIRITIDPMPRVNADADLLTRVYSNLLDNAIKFTRERREAAIHVGVTHGDAGPVFFVRDNGIGFDMQYVGKLFGVFQQLHRPGEYEGTGVGLATVQRIMRRHGGHVWAEAELNKGATFYFTL